MYPLLKLVAPTTQFVPTAALGAVDLCEALMRQLAAGAAAAAAAAGSSSIDEEHVVLTVQNILSGKLQEHCLNEIKKKHAPSFSDELAAAALSAAVLLQQAGSAAPAPAPALAPSPGAARKLATALEYLSLELCEAADQMRQKQDSGEAWRPAGQFISAAQLAQAVLQDEELAAAVQSCSWASAPKSAARALSAAAQAFSPAASCFSAMYVVAEEGAEGLPVDAKAVQRAAVARFFQGPEQREAQEQGSAAAAAAEALLAPFTQAAAPEAVLAELDLLDSFGTVVQELRSAPSEHEQEEALAANVFARAEAALQEGALISAPLPLGAVARLSSLSSAIIRAAKAGASLDAGQQRSLLSYAELAAAVMTQAQAEALAFCGDFGYEALPPGFQADGRLLLHVAAALGLERAVRELLAAGQAPDAVREDCEGAGSTALMLACTGSGHAGVVRALLQAGADANKRGSGYDYTPLLAAIDNKNSAAAAVLLQAGAEVQGRRHEGKSTAQYEEADEEGNPFVLGFLDQAFCPKPNRCSIPEKQSPAQAAADAAAHAALRALLLQRGAPSGKSAASAAIGTDAAATGTDAAATGTATA